MRRKRQYNRGMHSPSNLPLLCHGNFFPQDTSRVHVDVCREKIPPRLGCSRKQRLRPGVAGRLRFLRGKASEHMHMHGKYGRITLLIGTPSLSNPGDLSPPRLSSVNFSVFYLQRPKKSVLHGHWVICNGVFYVRSSQLVGRQSTTRYQPNFYETSLINYKVW